MQRQEQIAAFKRIAKRNYDQSMGWSTFVECYDNDDIERFFGGRIPKTEAEIESMMAEVVSASDDYYANAKNSAF